MLSYLRATDPSTVCGADALVDTSARERDGGILHLVGVVTEEVFGLLERATSAMTEAGVPQTILFLDHPRYEYLRKQFHSSIELVTFSGTGLGRVGGWVRLLGVFRSLVSEERFRAIHLHGFLPCLFGGYVVASEKLSARVLYSPHASKSLGPARPLGIAARRLLSDKCALAEQVSVASSRSEARSLQVVMARPVEVVENEIGLVFFDAVRNEARRPLVVAGGRRNDRESIEVYSRAAVLLGSADLRLSFNWCGPTEPHSRGRLYAANVGVYDVNSYADLATYLSSAWVFVQPSKKPGFPFHVASAMAVGVPCVVLDTEWHRDVIDHGETGFMYRNDVELVQCIAQLIDDPNLRARIGRAARNEARKRFGSERFRSSLGRIYAGRQPKHHGSGH